MISKSVSDPSLMFNRLDADGYSCQYRVDIHMSLPQAQRESRCVMILKTIPENVAEYVQQRLPFIEPFDWWWIRLDDGRIQVSLRSKAFVGLS